MIRHGRRLGRDAQPPQEIARAERLQKEYYEVAGRD